MQGPAWALSWRPTDELLRGSKSVVEASLSWCRLKPSRTVHPTLAAGGLRWPCLYREVFGLSGLGCRLLVVHHTMY